MSQYPPSVQGLHDAVSRVQGVTEVDLSIRRLDNVTEQMLSFPGEYGDLPHLAVRRTKGGLANELLVTVAVRLEQTFEGWIGLEFLAWWVRDLSRSGYWVQMRPLALPPVAYGTQLGRTLKFVIEFHFINPGPDNQPVLDQIGEFAKSLAGNIDDYAGALARPTRAAHDSLESLIASAENEDASAQLHLAQLYHGGNDVAQDLDAAFHWYERAAGHGHPQAVMRLGLCYAQGDGVAEDHAKSLELYLQAAKGGVGLAFGLVGQCYEQGKGVAADLAQAAEWYRRGADAGEASCQAELGECYELGKGVEKNPDEALKWYRLALENGLDAVQPAIERLQPHV